MSKHVELLDLRDKGYSFHLDKQMLESLSKEFDFHKLIDKVAKAINSGKKIKNIEKIFETYGEGLMNRSLQLGEEHVDHTYEVIKEVVNNLGERFKFPHVPQRFIELSYLGIFPEIPEVNVITSAQQIIQYTFDLNSCAIFKEMKQKCETKIVNALPCKHACLSLARTALNKLNINGDIKMDATIPKDGYCQFSLTQVKHTTKNNETA